MEELYAPEPQGWEFPRVVDELGGNDYEDWSEFPAEEEWHRAREPRHEWQPSVRQRGKRAKPPDTIDIEEMREERPRVECPEGPASSRYGARDRSRSPRDVGGMIESFQAAPHWSEQVTASAFLTEATPGFWKQEEAMVSLEIDMPVNRGASERALKNLSAFLTAALRKRAVEVSEKRMTEEERKAFQKAKGIEVTNFLSAKAFEALPPGYKANREDAVKMRWILTWKALPDGGQKAKARAVLLGYMDPKYSERATTSPTTTRQTRQIQLTIAAAKNFTTRKGDVTGAFLQSRSYPDDLLCIPCPEILEAMGLPPESITRVRRACYGLVDAPLEWYRSVSEFFNELGLRRCWSDPCCWTYVHQGHLQGLISGHVDDFVFSGNEEHDGWNLITKKIQQQYKWSDWEQGNFVQCGVKVETLANGSYALSQEQYVEDLKFINVRAHRKKDKHAETDELEKSQLRALLGGISWHGQQVAPHVCAEVSLLLSEVTKSTIETIFRANKLLNQVKKMKTHRLLIPKVNLENFGLFAWCDAASQNRLDGSSTQGYIIGAASMGMSRGECCALAPISWHSSKIQRVCRSPGASEAAAAVNTEDSLFFARFQFAEMLGREVNIRQVNKLVNTIPGCLITDSRNVYDKTSTEVVCTKGTERRVDIELMSLKYAQKRNFLEIRWVHSEAQLSNSLTKNEMRQLLLFYDMKQKWRIVQDQNMTSARKRRERGQAPLENEDESNSTTYTANNNLST